MEEIWIKLSYTEHDSMLIKTFATFFEKQDYLDVTFVCKDGKKVLASKLVLSCLSPFLKSLLSEWKGDQEMITLLLPEVDHFILKLIFDFVYEGVTKLSEIEFKGFKEILQILDIRLPGSTVIEPNVQSAPPNPPPPLAKLQKKSHVVKEKKSDTETDTEIKETSSAAEDTPVKRVNDPDYDPLDVPDFYYVPSTLTGPAAANSKQGSSNNVTDQQAGNTSTPTNDVQVKPNLNMKVPQQGKDGKNTGARKRTRPQKNSENPDAKRSAGRKTSPREREDSMDSSGSSRKRSHPHASSESENSLDVPRGTEQNKRGPGRRQSFTYMREDSMDFMVNDTVTPQRSQRSQNLKQKVKNLKEKKIRMAFNNEQLACLKREFTKNHYPTDLRRTELAKELGLDDVRIKIWFQNKRAKIKKTSDRKNLAQGPNKYSTIPITKEEEKQPTTTKANAKK